MNVAETLLHQTFDDPDVGAPLTWFCEPSRWRVASGRLVVEPDAETDYWQRTHYGFSADNGPFLHVPVASDFVMTTRVRFHPVNQYDQAGLMVRVDENHWLKTSVEYEGEHEPSKLGAVVTNGGYSDWSTQSFPDGVDEVVLRIQRTADDYVVSYALPDGTGAWSQLRMGHLHNPGGGSVQCGLYACCPTGAGYRAEFDYLSIHG